MVGVCDVVENLMSDISLDVVEMVGPNEPTVVTAAVCVVVAVFVLKPDKLDDITKVDEPLSGRELVAVCEVVTVGACVAVGVAVFVLKPDKLDDISGRELVAVCEITKVAVDVGETVLVHT